MSSIHQTLRTALSGLTVNQQGLQVTAQNLACENVEGYSRKRAQQSTLYSQGVGLGAYMSSIDRVVNEGMNRQARLQNSEFSYTNGLEEYYKQIQTFIGQPNDPQSLDALLNNFQAALRKASSAPQSSPLRQEVINSALMLTQKIRFISSELCNLRQKADQEIAQDLETVNDYVNQINSLSENLGNAYNLGESTGDFEDHKDLLLKKVSELLNIQVLPGNDAYNLQFNSRPVLLGGTVYPFTYTPVSSIVTPDILYSNGQIQPIKLLNQDVTSQFTSGRVGALLQMRDTIIPNNLQNQLDELAQDIRDEINAIYNQGSPYQGKTLMTGDRTFSAGGATAFNGTGILRIGVTDSAGMFTNEFQLNLSTVGTLTALINAINTAASWNTGAVGVTASLNSNNQLVLTGVGSNKFSLTSLGASAKETSTGLGFSHYFGLNNFFTSGNRYIQDGNALGRLGISNVIDVNPAVVSNDVLLSTGVLSSTTPLPLLPLNQNIGLTAGDGSILKAMNDALLDTTQSFAVAGNLPAMSTSFLTYTNYILSTLSQETAINTQHNNFNEQLLKNLEASAQQVSGVNRDEELTNIIMYEAAYQASARVFSAINAMMDALERIRN